MQPTSLADQTGATDTPNQHDIITGNSTAALTSDDGTVTGHSTISEYIESGDSAYCIVTLCLADGKVHSTGNCRMGKRKLTFASLAEEMLGF